MVKLIKVENNKINHIRLLYILLSKRKYNISHKKLPSYREHKKFVINSPYRVWYLIKNVNRFIGSTYISKENNIGINAFDINNDDYVKIIFGSHYIAEEVYTATGKHFDTTNN